MESASLYEKKASNGSMVKHENWELYKKRIEPEQLKEGEKYIILRECMDLDRIVTLEKYLKEQQRKHKDPVLMPWIDRPYGDTEGYGMYNRSEAEGLQKRAEEEGWPDPIPGWAYDLPWFQRRIKKIKNLKDKI